MRKAVLRGCVFWATCVMVMACGRADAGHDVYLALGDSITFGVGQDNSPADTGNGDRGYVKQYANYLAQASGTRPQVINLAVSGETSSSFFGVGSGLDGSDASARNDNYKGLAGTSQDALMLSTIAAQKQLGNTISTVTLTLGANDLFYALLTGVEPASVLPTFQANELALLTQIRGALPNANLIVLGYYDPYAPFANDPTSPFYQVAQKSMVAIPAINQYIAADAKAFGGTYVDTYTPFIGHELKETYILQNNVHPTDAGYDRIAAAIEAVPEPSSIVLAGLGLAASCGWAGLRSRRRRVTSAPTRTLRVGA